MSLPPLLNPQTPKLLSPLYLHTPLKLPSIHTLKYPRKFFSFSPSFQSSFPLRNDDSEDHAIGDCVVFEEGVFEDPHLESNLNAFLDGDSDSDTDNSRRKHKPNNKKTNLTEIETENLVPDKWREVQAEINITKKERRKIAQEMEFNSRVEKKKKGLLPIRSVNLEEYTAYREAKMAQLKPLVLDNPTNFPEEEEEEEKEDKKQRKSETNSERVAPKNPRWAVYGKGFDDVTEFFNSGNYEPGTKKSEGIAFYFDFCNWVRSYLDKCL